MVRYYDCLLRYHFPGIEPATLDDDDWAEYIAILEDIRNNEKGKPLQ
jgi:hypothetical protein